MRRRRWPWLAIVLILGACRGEAAGRPPALDACGLVRRAEAAAVLGPVAAPAASREGAADQLAGRSGCAWAAADGSGAVLVELVRTADMAARVRRTGFSAAARFRAARSRHPDAVPVDGLGAEAIWDATDGTLHMLAGASYVTFEVVAADPGRAEPVARALAERAVARLRRVDRPD